MATRDEILVALEGRYAAASREQKGRLITELAALTGCHRKHTALQRNIRQGMHPFRLNR
jgi:hypothetical protein